MGEMCPKSAILGVKTPILGYFRGYFTSFYMILVDFIRDLLFSFGNFLKFYFEHMNFIFKEIEHSMPHC